MQRTVIFFIMANTYTQCYFQLVFAVKNIDAFIKNSWKNELEFKDEYVFEFFNDVMWK